MLSLSSVLTIFIERLANRVADIVVKRLEAKWSLLNTYSELDERGRSYKEQWRKAETQEEKDAIQAKVHEYMLNLGK